MPPQGFFVAPKQTRDTWPLQCRFGVETPVFKVTERPKRPCNWTPFLLVITSYSVYTATCMAERNDIFCSCCFLQIHNFLKREYYKYNRRGLFTPESSGARSLSTFPTPRPPWVDYSTSRFFVVSPFNQCCIDVGFENVSGSWPRAAWWHKKQQTVRWLRRVYYFWNDD